VLPKLRMLDQVAYIRFASIYRDFRDVEGFAKELDALREDTGEGAPFSAHAGDGPTVESEETTDERAPVAAGE
jgi:transcriptional repressor NrdR